MKTLHNMEKGKLRKVFAKEFYEESDKFMSRYHEYCDRLAKVNEDEEAEIEALQGESFEDKLYLYIRENKDSIKKYNKKRADLLTKYHGYTDTDDADFYTELTPELVRLHKERVHFSTTIRMYLEFILINRGREFSYKGKNYRFTGMVETCCGRFYVGVPVSGTNEEVWVSDGNEKEMAWLGNNF